MATDGIREQGRGKILAAEIRKVASMPDCNVLATNHTGFPASDLDRAVAWFRGAPGLEVTSKAPRDPRAIDSVQKPPAHSEPVD